MITIRRAKQSDALAIAAVHVRTWQTAYRGIIPDEFLDKLSIPHRQNFWEKHLAALSSNSQVFVAVDSKAQLLGFSSTGPNRDSEHAYDGEVMALYLLKEHQGHGFGRRLFQASIDHLADNGCRNMLLWVLAQNPTCLFYSHFGGRPIAEKIVSIGGTPLKELAYAWENLSSLNTQQRIYHITTEAAWQKAQLDGDYQHPSLATEGFIHCSHREQLIPVANRYFRGQTGLLLFEIDVSKLKAPLNFENTSGGTELFPHLYGPLNLDALLKVDPIPSESVDDFLRSV